MPLIVLGAGGHGRDVAHVAQRAGWHVLGFLDDNLTGPEVVGGFDDWESFGAYALIGLNDSKLRAEVDQGLPAGRAVDPSVAWARDCRTGPGVVVSPNVAIGPGVVLGKHTHLGAGTTITRAVLGDYVTAAPGVTICGDVLIGDRVQIGAGAVIRNWVKIGDGATIGAGAVVLEDVAAGSTVVSPSLKAIRQ